MFVRVGLPLSPNVSHMTHNDCSTGFHPPFRSPPCAPPPHPPTALSCLSTTSRRSGRVADLHRRAQSEQQTSTFKGTLNFAPSSYSLTLCERGSPLSLTTALLRWTRREVVFGPVL